MAQVQRSPDAAARLGLNGEATGLFDGRLLRDQPVGQRALRIILIVLAVLFMLAILILQGTAYRMDPNESEYVAGAPTWTTEMVAWAFVAAFWVLSSATVAVHFSFPTVVWVLVVSATIFGLIISQQWTRYTENKDEETVGVLVWATALAALLLPSLLLGRTSGSPDGFFNAVASTTFIPLFMYLLYLMVVLLIDATVTESVAPECARPATATADAEKNKQWPAHSSTTAAAKTRQGVRARDRRCSSAGAWTSRALRSTRWPWSPLPRSRSRSCASANSSSRSRSRHCLSSVATRTINPRVATRTSSARSSRGFPDDVSLSRAEVAAILGNPQMLELAKQSGLATLNARGPQRHWKGDYFT